MHRTKLDRRAAIAAALALALALATLVALALQPNDATGETRADKQETILVSRSVTGGLPNGPSHRPVVSHDLRDASVAAFESRASNLVYKDTNGKRDVFVVFRDTPFSDRGTDWRVGKTRLASRGLGGKPANGDSWGAAVDGRPHRKPSCVAFVSRASNLVKRDTNKRSDAFVYNLRKKSVTRVSIGNRGQQSNGDTFDVAVDGECSRVAFTSDATNLALTKSKNKHAKALATRRPSGRRKQVYVRGLGGKGYDRALKGVTFMASASRKNKPGNGESTNPAFPFYRRAVAFQSTASNLAGSDRTPFNDIYLREFEPRKKPRTLLVSKTHKGKPGDDHSTNPVFSEQGFFIAYETLADNLAPGGPEGSDVVRADVRDSGKDPCPTARRVPSDRANQPSRNPSISNGGCYIVFDSDATNLDTEKRGADYNRNPDVFLYTGVRDLVLLQSRTSSGQRLTGPSTHPYLSSRGNYIFFENAGRIYQRYLGPR